MDAAIKPAYQRDAGVSYQARYSDLGDLLPGQGPRRAETTSPFTGREADIHAMAARLHEGVARRAAPPSSQRRSLPRPRSSQALRSIPADPGQGFGSRGPWACQAAEQLSAHRTGSGTASLRGGNDQ